MKTLSYNVYSFAELSPKAQQRALEDHRQFICEVWDSDCTQEDATRMLAFAGFTVEKIFFSGFSSQGDGACFEGSWQASAVNVAGMKEEAPTDTELHRIADAMAKLAAQFPHASLTVKHSGHYYHKYCTDFTVSICDENGDELPNTEATEKELIELSRDAMEWIYGQLEKDYEWQLEDEQVRDSMAANEYSFTQDGKIAPASL